MNARSVYERIRIVEGDITTQRGDAIVNAANSALQRGGGVDGAIHLAAGPQLQAECNALGGCPTGEARITQAYGLPAKHVIHAVGPRYRDGQHGEPELLASCFREAMRLAREHACETIAFPAISCGVYGYPMQAAADIAVRTVAAELSRADVPREVRFVLFGEAAHRTFLDAFERLARSEPRP
ncbi:MAG TPA: O-acetyl-ADP-ribose deacetylase [Phycisphaerae bacterium]